MDGFLRKAGDRLRTEIQDRLHQGDQEHSHTHDSGTCDHHHDNYGSSHRFQSFAPQSSGSVKWYVDGASYFWAVSMALEQARESIYILDWWLSPELYLRRPPAKNERYRLDNMLKAAAERGVEVRIIVYKEVRQALSCDSAHTKHALEALHENIRVFRHPDHVPNAEEVVSGFSELSLQSWAPGSLAKASTDALKSIYGQVGDSVLYWAHHEKLCLIDRKLAFMGGLDLCFGRWDTMSHPIADAHPGNIDATIFPGQDFNNARIFDFEGVNKWDHNQLDRTQNVRMGWSDITISMRGPIVGSLLDHFVDRWNFIFGDKYTKKDEGKYRRLAPRTGGQHMGLHEMRDQITRGEVDVHGMQDGLKRGMRRFMGGHEEDGGRSHGYDAQDGHHQVAIQLCRSCCEWSSGHPTEHSIANAYIDAITNAKHFVYIENQFFITATGNQQRPVTNKIGACIVNRIVRAHREGEDFRLIVIMPAVPAFPGDLKSDAALGTRAIMEFQYNSISRGGHSIIERLQQEGVENWRRYIGFYNLRNYDRINISSTMRQAEQDSGVSYEEGRRGYEARYSEGHHGGDQEPYRRYQSAASRADDQTWDTVSSCYMANGPDIRDVPWHGREEDELKAFVSEELYVHSKVLIADDRRVICGSANLNDRSQLGTHDSEIAVVIEDPEMVDSTMNGRPYRASRFATSLRRQLYRKHLGLIGDQRWDRPGPNWTPVGVDPQRYDWGSPNDRLVEDPLSEDFRRLWRETARTNTQVFDRVFHPVPSNHTRNWKQYDDFFSRHFVVPGSEEETRIKKENGGRLVLPPGKVAYGHVVPGEFSSAREVKEELSRVRGTLVDLPLDFLVELGEDMAMEGVGLNFATKEIYT